MAGRPRRFGPAQVATGPATVYTCPALMYAEVVYLEFNNPSASAVTITVSVTADAAGTRVKTISVPANTGDNRNNVVFSPGWALAAAEVITMSAGTNNIVVQIGEVLEYVL